MRRTLPRLLLIPTIAVATIASANTPDGASIVLHGNANGALPCAACHGAAGQGNTSIGAPRLAGLPAPVIESALKSYAAGHGGTALMQSIARALSPAETTAVATYFASLPAKNP
jgi:cytochrome c553